MSKYSKKQLLQEIEQKEMDRLMSLNNFELTHEYEEWFGEEADRDHDSLVAEMLEDFMGYRFDESEEELQEKLKAYSN